MTEKKLSTLGYLMDRLGLSTAGLARRLHVDASLVSKWRSGNRRLHVKSVYFEDICEMFLEQDRAALCDALRSLIPLEEAKAPMDTAILLRRVLTDRHFTVPRAFTLRTEAVSSSSHRLCSESTYNISPGSSMASATSRRSDIACRLPSVLV